MAELIPDSIGEMSGQLCAQQRQISHYQAVFDCSMEQGDPVHPQTGVLHLLHLKKISIVL